MPYTYVDTSSTSTADETGYMYGTAMWTYEPTVPKKKKKQGYDWKRRYEK